MEAPDKVYLRRTQSGHISEFYGTFPIPEFDNVEYIRKEALLEWAKEQKTLMELGGHVSIDDVIDKLNSI